MSQASEKVEGAANSFQIGASSIRLDDNGFLIGQPFFDEVQNFGLPKHLDIDFKNAVYGDYWLDDGKQKIFFHYDSKEFVSVKNIKKVKKVAK